MLNPELWIVTSAHNDYRSGLVATFVNNASIVAHLPRVIVGIAKHHFTWDHIEQCRAFALHLISENQLDWVWRFGLESGRDVDKFAGLSVLENDARTPLLSDALGWLDCCVESSLDTGDRSVYLAEVVAGQMNRSERPLTMQRLLQLAPQDKLEAMAKQREQDAEIDARAIMASRESVTPNKD